MSIAKLRRNSHRKEVRVLKSWLNLVLDPSPGLSDNTHFDRATQDAVVRFETLNGFESPDGTVDAATWAALGRQLGPRAFMINRLLDVPLWTINLFALDLVGRLRFRRDTFFGLFMEEYGALDDSQLLGIEQLLSFIEGDPQILDVRWAAYMLATVRLECANRWQPIKEYGCVEGRTPVCTPYTRDGVVHQRDYGNPVPCANLHTKPPGTCPANQTAHCYYGRGYVQLTHKGNYAQMSTALFGDDQLVHFPERVMEPSTAYRIMSLGMREGRFRSSTAHDAHTHSIVHVPHTLQRYLNESTTDYYRARNIINGVVPATAREIAAAARAIEAMLTASRM